LPSRAFKRIFEDHPESLVRVVQVRKTFLIRVFKAKKNSSNITYRYVTNVNMFVCHNIFNAA